MQHQVTIKKNARTYGSIFIEAYPDEDYFTLDIRTPDKVLLGKFSREDHTILIQKLWLHGFDSAGIKHIRNILRKIGV